MPVDAIVRRFRFCPDCGRELGEKAEASVEERAETLEETVHRRHHVYIRRIEALEERVERYRVAKNEARIARLGERSSGNECRLEECAKRVEKRLVVLEEQVGEPQGVPRGVTAKRLEALETGRAGQKSGCPSRIQLWVRIQVLEERSENWRRRIEALEKQVAALERRNTAPGGD